jgi:hypothetical protein
MDFIDEVGVREATLKACAVGVETEIIDRPTIALGESG